MRTRVLAWPGFVERNVPLPTAYLITTKNLEAFLNAIKTAKAPDRVNIQFLKNLDLTSSNDRLLIGVLKALGFADESGVPTGRYFEFLDQTRSGAVLAGAIQEAYGDLFAVNTKAQHLSAEEIKNKLRTLTQGQHSDVVLGNMARTFRALADLADWGSPAPSGTSTPRAPLLATDEAENDDEDEEESPGPRPPKPTGTPKLQPRELHYNIQIVLPDSRDPAVYDAIFDSLRRHLS